MKKGESLMPFFLRFKDGMKKISCLQHDLGVYLSSFSALNLVNRFDNNICTSFFVEINLRKKNLWLYLF